VLIDDSHSISLWRLSELVKSVPFPHTVNRRLPLSADGRLAAIFGEEKGLQLWDVAELKPVGHPFDQIRTYPPSDRFSPDGKYVIGTDKSSQVSAWDISRGNLVWQSPGAPGFAGEGMVQAAVQPDGKNLIVSCWLGAARGELSGWAFEPALSDVRPTIASSAAWVLPVRSVIGTWCFSGDGNELYVGDAEGHLGIVNLALHELHALNGQHDGRVTWMGLSRDGQRLATTSIDGTARLWDVRMKSPEPLVVSNGPSVWDAKFSPDSRWFVCAGEGGAEIRDAHSAALLRRLPMDQFVTDVAISRDGRRVAACGNEGRTDMWDAETGVALFPPIQGGPADEVEFSPDGRWFLIVSSTPKMEVHETETGRQIGPALTNSSPVVMAAFSPDGSTVVAGADNGTVEFWSLAEGRRLETPTRHKDVVWTTRFSPNGRRLLTASRDRTAGLWEADSGTLVREFRHDEQVYTADFSPDGTRIVTGDAGRKAHMWDARTGKRLFSLPAHPGGVWYAEFSSDGRLLLTGDDAGNARLWEAASGLPLSGWVHNGPSLKCTRFSPDGRMALSAADSGTVRLWPVVLAPLPAPAWVPDLAETIAGHRLRDDGTPEILPPERWLTLRASLASLEGNDFYPRWARWFFAERMTERPAAFVP
jgi:WD40 repeat protein